MSDFTVRRNDNKIVVPCTLFDANGAIDLTGSVIRFHLVPALGGAAKVDALATADGDQTVNRGKVTYSLTSADLSTAGDYVFEWQVTFSDGKVLTFPTQDDPQNLTMKIIPDLK